MMHFLRKSSPLTKPTDLQNSSRIINILISTLYNTFEMTSVGNFNPGPHLGARVSQTTVTKPKKSENPPGSQHQTWRSDVGIQVDFLSFSVLL